jgi:L-lactate utilization protein LutC
MSAAGLRHVLELVRVGGVHGPRRLEVVIAE